MDWVDVRNCRSNDVGLLTGTVSNSGGGGGGKMKEGEEQGAGDSDLGGSDEQVEGDVSQNDGGDGSDGDDGEEVEGDVIQDDGGGGSGGDDGDGGGSGDGSRFLFKFRRVVFVFPSFWGRRGRKIRRDNPA